MCSSDLMTNVIFIIIIIYLLLLFGIVLLFGAKVLLFRVMFLVTLQE